MNLSGDKALNFVQRPKAGINVVLAFGEDLGVVSDAAQTLVQKWRKVENSELDIVRLHEDELKKDPGLLTEHLSAVSLLGIKQILRVRLSNESIAKQLIAIVDQIATGKLYPENFLILEAGELKKSSKLRTSFSTSPDTACLQFFADSDVETSEYIRIKLSDQNIQIDELALEQFAAELPGDRRLANAEIEKLSLYAFDLGRSIQPDDIKAICSTEQPRGADNAADAALAGDIDEANKSLDRFLDAGGSAISALRTLHYRLLRVIDAQSGARFLRPPVFDRDRPAFNKMLKDWDAARLNRALSTLYAAEKTCKQGGIPAEAILKIVIDRFSRRQV
ncbi:DNA polymerase III subunit delta [Hirschia baltica]|uniref:DNA-directed DNA polymerase n=1 Tax=Hirschia baltica (strain ATCC 49814 / DSM 5838 / IFAM 1418) TaxID=582402 RepID=C6XKA9_HIRBI|nr:DNA polymerase III subunit delta [Hirschia baltica]ACT57707.1 DNA polymerase III, delta subunit [Hirschia baltica ATCC 49814]